MYKLLKLSIISLGLVAVWSTGGGAFQLFGEASTRAVAVEKSPGGPLANIGDEGDTGSTQLDLSDKSHPDVGAAGSRDIWIPGLGVVGKMPDFDFGLEMLYGDNGDDAPGGAGNSPEILDMDQNRDDFSIKGTVKRKF